MDQEMDEWYNSEKEKLTERYLADKAEKRIPAERLEADFHKKFKHLQQVYEQEMILRTKLNPIEKRVSRLDRMWRSIVVFFR